MLQTKNIPVFILAGGLGTRFSEETHIKPKPMIEIGNLPILLHIMRYYYKAGFNDFVICAGYRSWDIKEYFLNYQNRQNHLSIDLRGNSNAVTRNEFDLIGHEKWRVRVIDTGVNSMTGARLACAFDQVSAKEKFDHFAVTYGDGLTNVNLKAQLEFHEKHKKIGTVLGVPPKSRFGVLEYDAQSSVTRFQEKPATVSELINGGFFIFGSDFRSYLETSSDCILEQSPLEKLVNDQQLKVFEHKGFWQCMDTLRDKNYLQDLWDKHEAPWNLEG